MLNLLGHATTPDKLRLITNNAGDVDVHVSYVDVDSTSAPPVTQDANRQNTTITSATTTDICAGVTNANRRRNVKTIFIRNTHATVTNDVTVYIDQGGGTIFELWKCSLAPGEQLEYVEGLGFFEAAASPASVLGTNFANASTSAGFAADTYLANTAVPLSALGTPTVGRIFHFRLIISKTAAGTAAPVLTVRLGTAQTTSDTAVVTFTWGAGTAAIDRGEIEAEVLVTTAGASGILRGKANFTTNLQTTGLSSTIKALQVTSGTVDLTAANRFLGCSWNGGTSAVHTVEWQSAWTEQL